MTISELKASLTPFKPININLENGVSIFIPYKEYLIFLPEVAGDNIIILNKEGNIHFLNVKGIISIDYYVIEKRN